jgi:tRNA nucleotidyltransferase/poly(A) polymerase
MGLNTSSETALSGRSFADRVIAFIRGRVEPGKAWLVGGFVRDRLLGRPTNDLDIAVASGGIRLARAVAEAFGGASFVLDEERDVGRALLPLPGATGTLFSVDVAQLRQPELVADLSLRDFTINAMAMDVIGSQGAAEPSSVPPIGQPGFCDPFGGRTDLSRALVRAVSEGTFRDDPLRTLRGVRQAVELGFHIEDTTLEWIRRDAPLLASVAPERIRDELMRLIAVPGAWQHLRLLRSAGLLPHTLPEVAALVGISQTPPHYQDVFDHTRSVMGHLEGIYALLWPEGRYQRPVAVADDPTVLAGEDTWAELADALTPYGDDLRAHLLLPLAANRSRRDVLLWAALAHDWGKPAMRTADEDGRVRFFVHDRWGALLARTRFQALKFASDEVVYLGRLVDQHMRPAYLAHDYPPSRRAMYRFFREAISTGPDCALLSLADHMATWAPDPDPGRWGNCLRTTELLLETYFRERGERVEPCPLLDGRQIMAEFGLRPGPHVGELLDGLREAQAVGEVTTVEQAVAWVTERVRQDG